jgi:hypothetical protein
MNRTLRTSWTRPTSSSAAETSLEQTRRAPSRLLDPVRTLFFVLAAKQQSRIKLTSKWAASICYFRFETEIGEILLFHTHTPLEPLLQKVEFRYWADKSIPRL